MSQTEKFNEFTVNVRKCEAKLQNLIATKSLNGAASISEIIKPRSPEKAEKQSAKEASNVNDDCIVTDIDPNQDYESSDDDFSMDSDSETTNNNNNEIVMPSQMQTAVPSVIPEVKKLKIKLNPPSAIVQTPFNIEEQLCVFCDRPFLNQQERKDHEESIHEIIAPYNCNFCAFKTNTKQFVIQHIKEVHQQVSLYIY